MTPAQLDVDRALIAGEAILSHDGSLIVCPDVMFVEAAANGDDVDPEATWRVLRWDGRWVALYRAPDGDASSDR